MSEQKEFREKVEADRKLLERYSLRVLRVVARHQLPTPVPDVNQTVRRKVWKHYQNFLHTYPKEALIGALLPYMNSNAERLLEETAIWVELHPRKSGKGKWKGKVAYDRRQWEKRKLVIQWMKAHPEQVLRIYNKSIPMSSGTS